MNVTSYALSIDAPVCRYVDLDLRLDPDCERELSEEERVRASRLHFGIDRERFIAAHVALRRALAEQSALRADTLCLVCGPFGKPWMPERPRIRFSLSHSHALALIAVGTRGPLGADVEHLRPVPDALTLAERHFTPREYEALLALPAARRGLAFLTCWTRKEACLKAIGLGLRVRPDTVEVGLRPELRSVEVPLGGRILWLVVGPAPARPGSVASLAEWRAPETLFDTPEALSQMLAMQALRANPGAAFAGDPVRGVEVAR